MEDPKFYAPLKKSAGSKENIVVGSYLQSYKYFQAQQLDIRRIFTFKDSVQARVRKWFEGTLRGQRASKFVVGIHVRGGDHSGKSNWQPFLRMPPDKWFKARMDHLREQHKNVVFVVCSDDHKLGTPTLLRVFSFCARRCYQTWYANPLARVFFLLARRWAHLACPAPRSQVPRRVQWQGRRGVAHQVRVPGHGHRGVLRRRDLLSGDVRLVGGLALEQDCVLPGRVRLGS